MHQTSDTTHQTPNTQHQASSTQHHTTNTWHPSIKIRASEVKDSFLEEGKGVLTKQNVEVFN